MGADLAIYRTILLSITIPISYVLHCVLILDEGWMIDAWRC